MESQPENPAVWYTLGNQINTWKIYGSVRKCFFCLFASRTTAVTSTWRARGYLVLCIYSVRLGPTSWLLQLVCLFMAVKQGGPQGWTDNDLTAVLFSQLKQCLLVSGCLTVSKRDRFINFTECDLSDWQATCIKRDRQAQPSRFHPGWN